MRKRALLLTAALSGGLLSLTSPASAAPSGLQGDFNGDGYRDVAFAAPYANVAGKGMAGYVAVVYGGATGLDPAKRTVINQSSAGIPGTPEAEDVFGDALAVADFNGDKYADLAVGASGEAIGTEDNAGSVTIVWGGAAGLSGGTTVKDPATSQHSEFGRVLAAGDFDGDGKPDLAAGTSEGHAYVVKGGFTKSGSTGAAQKVVMPDEVKYGIDAIAAGDTNGDKKADLVLTYRTSTQDFEDWSKGVAFLGTSSGLETAVPRPLNGGTSLALGDIDGDGYDEIAIGNVFAKEDDHTGTLGGRVVVIRGSQGGPINGDIPMATLTQDSNGVPGTDEKGDGFGNAVSIADTDKDGYAELAIGVVFEDIGTAEDTGSVIVMRGSAEGVARTGALSLNQSTAGVPGAAESMDYFGSDVLLSDVTKDGRADLTTAAGFENEGAGAVWALRSTTTGVSTTGAKSFGPSAFNLPTKYGAFGSGLTG
ncbi:FG-GAP-like repeat-containing protein [Streptomyces sp. NBC_01304]|uniref:FG-GAP-like repeat-containing protein n=1 Tax=Streptomyces sp. NBC_01304 TaxID=2903818 RepID=UPI002E14EF0E|nr:FG-GAP-like repeat-containing protein [Streptomyces sp. NBC_01304]